MLTGKLEIMIINTSPVLSKSYATFKLECVHRMYLNDNVPRQQTRADVAYFIRQEFDCAMAFTSLLEPMTRQDIDNVKQFVEHEQLELISFKEGERNDDIAKVYLAEFEYEEGVMLVGKLCGHLHNYLPTRKIAFDKLLSK